MQIKQTSIYFPNLDGLRFFAFSLVFFNHIFFVKNTGLDPSGELYAFLQNMDKNGALGVNLFFVLSGFLITYLLLNEQTRYGKIHLINFYIRRFLRIWPLYFTMVAIGFLAFPLLKQMMGQASTESHSVIFYLFFISNFHMINMGWPDSSVLSVLWSVGIEEQFYLFWPVLLKIIPQRFLPVAFCCLIAGTLLFRNFYWNDNKILYFHTFSVISDMVVGGLAAWFSFKSSSFKNAIENMAGWKIKLVYIAGLLVILFNYKIFSTPLLITFERLIISLFFVFVILEQNFSKYSFYKCSSGKWISRWGNYTYGLYCWQMPALLITHLVIFKLITVTNPWVEMLLSLITGLPLTMLLAYISYHTLEKPFLKLKEKFAFIVK